jgi:hypothetical protein
MVSPHSAIFSPTLELGYDGSGHEMMPCLLPVSLVVGSRMTDANVLLCRNFDGAAMLHWTVRKVK